MLGDPVGAGWHGIDQVARATGRATRLADVRTDDADRVMNGERQRYRAPAAILVQDQLGRRRSAAGQRSQQLETPVVLIGGESLPAALVLVPKTPDPVAATDLSREQARGFVQIDNRVALGRRVADRVPYRLGRLVDIGRIGVRVAEVEDGLATLHLGPAVRLRRGGCGPLAR